MKKIVSHGILIILLLSVPVVSSPDFDGSLSVFKIIPFQREFLRFILMIVFFYLNLNVFLPKFYAQKKYLFFAISIVLFFIIMVLLPNQLKGQEYLNTPKISQRFHPQQNNFDVNYKTSPSDSGMMPPRDSFFPDKNRHPPFENNRMKPNSIYQKFFTSIVPFLFSLLGSLFIYKNEEQKELEKAKTKAELLSLKYQLQPHFLFNILNSIYSLAMTKSDDAPNGILKLSNVMRYIVQESSNDFVDLEKEITYLKDYISLQLMRTDTALDFSYTEIGNSENLKIAPLILVNFIENAFKYGFNPEKDSKISVYILIEEHNLTLEISNNIVKHYDTEDSRIGIKNTLKRLQNIYPQEHSIEIINDGMVYKVNLKITLLNKNQLS